jgi:hypothetical protein
MLNGRISTTDSTSYTGLLVFRQNASGSDNTVLKARIYGKMNQSQRSKIIKMSIVCCVGLSRRDGDEQGTPFENPYKP